MTQKIQQTQETTQLAPTTKFVDDASFVATLKPVVEPSVRAINIFRASGATLTIINFINGSDAQQIMILGDGTTTVANNTRIKTLSGANTLLALGKIFKYIAISDPVTKLLIWYEH